MKETTNNQFLSETFNEYKEDAEKGNAEAQYHLGSRYFFGLGVKQDYNEAAKWFKKAAAQGHSGAIKEIEDFR